MMKEVVVLALILCLFGVSGFNYDLDLPVVTLFNQYIQRNSIQFKSETEASLRYVIFETNVRKIKGLNAMNTNAKFGINKYALLSQEEFAEKYLTLRTPDITAPEAPVYPQSVLDKIPESFDWRTKGAVTGVKDQGQCGSCWTFSTTGNIEGQWFLSGHPMVSLSEQNIVDCDHLCVNGSCDAGCNGGLMGSAFEYIIQQGGIDTEASYPYTAEDGDCRFNKSNIGAHISGWNMVSQDEAQMAAYLVEHGPLSVAVDATSWQFYITGVLYNPIPCGTSLDHGVLIVGYGTETNILGETIPYWIIKNSWGADWGESGYIEIERGDGYCGVNLYCCSSFVNK